MRVTSLPSYTNGGPEVTALTSHPVDFPSCPNGARSDTPVSGQFLPSIKRNRYKTFSGEPVWPSGKVLGW